ncbi:hypothetical protein R1sor_024851 [Riccia sorocarpa]|uniref:WW domain-containing protein n=1 Tax=Riccia sorocarpa TaxID=122646 RepID=A0ABD3GUV9_9MARC
MQMTGQVPRLSYSQLFSFQVAHNLVAAQETTDRYHVNLQAFKDLLKKGEWNRSILEVDFTNSMVFLQDKDKVVAAQPFANFKKFVLSGDDFEDNLISVRFVSQQWQIMTQNSAEKTCLLHLLQCVAKDLSAEEALASASPGILGLNKSVLRAGTLVRKAKTQAKKDGRYCVLVPGKLFIFKNPNLIGQHLRYVTSLLGASVRMLQGLEFELLVPGTKTLTFLPENLEEASGWMGALERSVEIAQHILAGGTYEQQDQVSNNIFGTMNPGVAAGMMPGPSAGAGAGGFVQTTATHSLGAYTNPQDSRTIRQRFAAGLAGGGIFQQPRQERSFPTPLGVSAPYVGTYQSNTGRGNVQNPLSAANVQRMGGMPQQGGPTAGMLGQGGSMDQNLAGLSTGDKQSQGNYNIQNQVNLGSSGRWGQVQQNPGAIPAETGVRMIRRATQTLREFNDNMDQFLAQPSTSGYGSTVPQTETHGFGGGASQTQFQDFSGAQQMQSPGYGRVVPQPQIQGYSSLQQAQGTGSSMETSQAPDQGYADPQQAQTQMSGRGTHGQGFGGSQQLQNQGYRRGAVQTQGQVYGNRQAQAPGFNRGSPQPQAQAYGGIQAAQSPRYSRGGPQGQGEPRGQGQGYTGAQQSEQAQQFQDNGRGASQREGERYGSGKPGVQAQGQAQGYSRGAPQSPSQGYGGAPRAPVQQAPAYGGGNPQMQTPGYGRGALRVQHPGRQQFQGQPGMAPASRTGDWKEFTSPDGRTYYYNERTRQTTWKRPY